MRARYDLCGGRVGVEERVRKSCYSTALPSRAQQCVPDSPGVLLCCRYIPQTSSERAAFSNRLWRTITGSTTHHERLEPAAVEPDLLDIATLICCGIVRERHALMSGKIIVSSRRVRIATDTVEQERVTAQDEVLLGKRDAGNRL